VEVIYMLLQYCAEAGKTNIGYIEAAGRDWGRREIDTIEKAGEQIAALKEKLARGNDLRRLAGRHAPRPTAAQGEHLRRWRAMGYGTDMVFAAYEEMAEHTGKLSFSYMNKVLETWHAAGVKTPAEAAAAKERFQAEKAGPEKPAAKKEKQGAAGYGPSFDLEAFERSTLQVPVFE
jgi:DnaD/phage-associated family protein